MVERSGRSPLERSRVYCGGEERRAQHRDTWTAGFRTGQHRRRTRGGHRHGHGVTRQGARRSEEPPPPCRAPWKQLPHVVHGCLRYQGPASCLGAGCLRREGILSCLGADEQALH